MKFGGILARTDWKVVSRTLWGDVQTWPHHLSSCPSLRRCLAWCNKRFSVDTVFLKSEPAAWLKHLEYTPYQNVFSSLVWTYARVNSSCLNLGDEVLLSCGPNNPDMQKSTQTIQICVALTGKFGCYLREVGWFFVHFINQDKIKQGRVDYSRKNIIIISYFLTVFASALWTQLQPLSEANLDKPVRRPQEDERQSLLYYS